MNRANRLFMVVLVLAQSVAPVTSVSACAMETAGATEACCCCSPPATMTMTGPLVGPVGCCRLDPGETSPLPPPAVPAPEPSLPDGASGPAVGSDPPVDVLLQVEAPDQPPAARSHAPPAYTLFCTYLI